ncbi:MAG: hypothetical protein ACXAC8_07940 [Candidatus Hodarchaeales archaeon]|jgi:ribosomal protein S25
MSFTDKRVKKKRRWGKVFEYSSYERSLPVDEDYTQLLKELEDEYSKKKTGVVVTAQDIAVKHDIRVSIAKRILTDLEEKKILNEAFSNRRLKVYVKT